MEKLEKLYEGKAKVIYQTDDPDKLIAYFKDSATAFDALKKATIEGKGVLNNKIASFFFELLNREGIPTHFIKQISDREMLVYRVEIIPVEVVVRNIAAGSIVKRLGIEEKTEFKPPLIEFYLKNDELHDPIICKEHVLVPDGSIVVADEISPDTCRLWDKKTGEKLDKDRFRFDLGDLIEGYMKVLKKIEKGE